MEENKKFRIPNGWEWKKLWECLENIESGKRPKGGVQNILQGIPSIGAEHLNNEGGFKFSKIKYVTEEFAGSMVKGIVKKNDIIIVKDGATTGKTSFVGNNFPFDFAVINEHVFLCRTRVNINSKLIYYYLWSRTGKNQILNDFRGAAQGGISTNFVNCVNIPLPALSIQNEIVSKIEEFFSELDNGVEELKKVKAQLKTYRKTVLHAAFTGKLTKDWRKENSELRMKKASDIVISGNAGIQKNELPKGWEKLKLKDLSVLITKGASPKWQGFNYTNDNSQLLFVTSENVRENYLDIEKPKFLQLEFNIKQKRSSLKYGDVLFNLVGASIGRATIYNLDRKANINQAVSVIRLTENLINKYLCYFLNSELAKQTYMKNIVDVARANLSLFDVSNLLIPLPSLDEQQKIVEEIETRLSVCDKMEETIETALSKSESLRQSILKQAFEGKLIK